MKLVSKVRIWEAPASKPGSSLRKTSLYLRHQPRCRPSRASLISASRWAPFDAVDLAQVGDVVAVGGDPPGLLDVVELGGAPAELPLHLAGGQAAGFAQLDQLAAERAFPDGGAVAGHPRLVHGHFLPAADVPSG